MKRSLWVSHRHFAREKRLLKEEEEAKSCQSMKKRKRKKRMQLESKRVAAVAVYEMRGRTRPLMFQRQLLLQIAPAIATPQG